MDPHLPHTLPPSIGGESKPLGGGVFTRRPAAGAFDSIGQNFKFAPPARKEALKLSSPFVPSASGPLNPGLASGNRKRPFETKDGGFPIPGTSRPAKRERIAARSGNSSAKPAVIVLDDDDNEAENKYPALVAAPENGNSNKAPVSGTHSGAAQGGKVLRSGEDGSRARKRSSEFPSAGSDSSAQSSQASGRTVLPHDRNLGRRHYHHPASAAGKDKPDPPIPTTPNFSDALDWNRSQRNLLIAMNSLSAEKESLEKELTAKDLALEAEHRLAEAERERGAQLEIKIAKDTKKISTIKEKVDGLHKFFNGMGCDYKVLQEKYTKLNALFTEACKEKGNIQSDHEEIRLVVQRLEKENMNEANVYLQQQLSENAGLLAAERDRVQTLELQAREDLNYFRHEIEQRQIMFDITRKNLTDFEKQLSEVDNIGRAIGTIKESNSKIAEQLIQNLSTKYVQLETNLSIRVHDIKSVIEDATRLNGLASIFEKIDMRSDYQKMVNEYASIVKISTQTHKITSDSASFGSEFVEHLNSQIRHLEGQLEELRKCRRIDLAKLTQREAELNGLKHEIEEKQSEGLLCTRLETLLQGGNALLSEKIASLGSNIQNGLGDSSIVALKQEVSELNGKLEQITRSFHDHLSEKNREISRLESQARSLDLVYSEARKKIANFDKEKTEYMSLLGSQRLQERIELENAANSLRLSETSSLNNRIRSLEVQKERLEAANTLLEERLQTKAPKDLAPDLERINSETVSKCNNLERELRELTFQSSMERTLADAKCQQLSTESELRQQVEDLQTNLISSNQELIDAQARSKVFRQNLRDAMQTLETSQATLNRVILVTIQGRSENKSLAVRLRNLEDVNQRLLGKGGVTTNPASGQLEQPRNALSQSQPPHKSGATRKSGKDKNFETPIMSLTSISDAPEFQREEPSGDEEVDYQRLAAEILHTNDRARVNRSTTSIESLVKPIAPRSKPRESQVGPGDSGKRYNQALKTLSSSARKAPATKTMITEDSQNSDEEKYWALPPMSSPQFHLSPANPNVDGPSKLNSGESRWGTLNRQFQSGQPPQVAEKTKVSSGHRSEALGHETGKQTKPKLVRHRNKKVRDEDAMTEESTKEQESGGKGTGAHSSGSFKAAQKKKRASKKH
ncbi:unnamed protein product [Tuber aestivum]|uniref:Uncharacterized protein n=1 Tax=Tuber aestivum TaxID=59557 RepID=A0A292Q2V0_9PEZI|nr:unnamed protein product [Tuber aestivum]